MEGDLIARIPSLRWRFTLNDSGSVLFPIPVLFRYFSAHDLKAASKSVRMDSAAFNRSIGASVLWFCYMRATEQSSSGAYNRCDVVELVR